LRYFFHIAYQGKNYNGWQKQKDNFSIQQVLEDKLSQILKTPIAIVGCGRTDAKVNASQFFFHADLLSIPADTLFFRLNRLLPSDIAVFDIIPMQDLPHCRFDAIQRQYHYFIHTNKNPFLSDVSSLYLDLKFDLNALKAATNLLTKYEDFRPFCTSPDKNEHTICRVSSAQWLVSDHGNRYCFQISANRFLSKMIRIIVGQLLKVGNGDLSVADFEMYLKDKETPKILSPAHPQGLYLAKVTYPYLDLKTQADFFNVSELSGGWQLL
jgi:tRNA pseudouridine38-40 synthase